MMWIAIRYIWMLFCSDFGAFHTEICRVNGAILCEVLCYDAAPLLGY